MAEEGVFVPGLSGSIDWLAAHPNVFSSGTGLYTYYTYTGFQRQFWMPSPPSFELLIWQDVAPDDEPLDSLYSDYISAPSMRPAKAFFSFAASDSNPAYSTPLSSRSAHLAARERSHRRVFFAYLSPIQ